MPWTVAHQAPLSTGFPRQEYWSGLPFPSPEDLPDPGIEPTSLMSPALPGGFFTTSGTANKIKASNDCKHDQRTQEKNGLNTEVKKTWKI